MSVAPRRNAVADRAQTAQPLGGARSSGADHDENVRSTDREDIQDLGEREQLLADLIDPLVGARNVHLMGLHPYLR